MNFLPVQKGWDCHRDKTTNLLIGDNIIEMRIEKLNRLIADDANKILERGQIFEDKIDPKLLEDEESDDLDDWDGMGRLM